MSEIRYGLQAEQRLDFPLPDTDGLRIGGMLRGDLSRPTVVMMHGLTGNANATQMYLGSRYLHQAGFATLRLNMYDYTEDTRDLHDCVLETHISDFELVISALRNKALEEHRDATIYAVGHSVGGLTILGSKSEFNGAALWDPSHGQWFANSSERDADDSSVVYLQGNRVSLRGAGAVWPSAMEASKADLGDTTAWAAKDYPLKIVSAGDGVLTETNKMYATAANEPTAYVTIEGATHGFDDSDETMYQLFDETVKWFEGIENGTIR